MSGLSDMMDDTSQSHRGIWISGFFKFIRLQIQPWFCTDWMKARYLSKLLLLHVCFTTSLKKIWFLDSKDVNIPIQATSATSFVSLRIWRSWLTSMIWMFSAQKIIDHSVRWFDLMPKDPIWYISHFFVFNRGSQILQWLVILVFYIDLIDQGYLVFL